MSQKALDTFFRHKLLVILPLVLLIFAGTAFAVLQKSDQYQAQAKIWVQKTPLLSSQLGSAISSSSPASSQSKVLTDLLNLRSFRTDVAAEVPQLSGLSSDEQVRAVSTGTAVYPSGSYVLVIQNKGGDAELSAAIVSAVIKVYSDRFSTNVVAESDAASAFYKQQLTAASAKLQTAKTDLASYQQSVTTSTAPVGRTMADPQLTSLTAALDTAQTDYNDVVNRLQEVALQRDAALQGRDLSFQVMDPASTPTSPTAASKRDMLMLPGLGGLLGIAAAAVVLLALVRMDSNIRLTQEAGKSGVPILAVIPDLGRHRRRSWPQTFVRQVVAASRGLVSG